MSQTACLIHAMRPVLSVAPSSRFLLCRGSSKHFACIPRSPHTVLHALSQQVTPLVRSGAPRSPHFRIRKEHDMQEGSVIREQRKLGPDVWSYRWWESGPSGNRVHRRIVLGTAEQLRDMVSARQMTAGLMREINASDIRLAGTSMTMAQLADHYQQRELGRSNRPKSPRISPPPAAEQPRAPPSWAHWHCRARRDLKRRRGSPGPLPHVSLAG